MKSKKGSALLIVLGMLAFMIISAVAFAAYMRFARLPSSYLRRTTSSRQLAKAALARAIDQIDSAIGNNAHPGVGQAPTMYPRYEGTSENRNIWLHRVFFGDDQATTEASTVPVLTLEGLAYIPPPLVNEARFLSRKSPTAIWKSLDFDSGRYAYCALDVSDYFDINRLFADSPRSSAANRRISLAYLFENDAHTQAGSTAQTWDTWMENYRTLDEESFELDWSGNIYPFVSLADYNLALGEKGSIGQFKSPFVEYIKNGGSGGFYSAFGTGDANKDLLRRMTFVTDGLFPEVSTNDYDLANAENQPFSSQFLKKTNPTLSAVIDGDELQNDDKMGWDKRLSALGCATLYDYLDEDHVPISLAIPTFERTPMICGISADIGTPKLAVTKTLQNNLQEVDNGDGTRTATQDVLYRLDAKKLVTDGFLTGSLKALVTYPFSHKADDDGTFKVDGRVAFFFTTSDMGLRTGASSAGDVQSEALHLESKSIPEPGLNADTGVMSLKLNSKSISFNDEMTTEQKAIKDIDFDLTGADTVGSALSNDGTPLVRVTYKWTQRKQGGNTGGVGSMVSYTPKNFDEALKDSICGLTVQEAEYCIPALTSKGIVDPNSKGVKNALEERTLSLNMAVTLRVLDKNDKVVDMVPACLYDDKNQNDISVNDMLMDANNGNFVSGVPYPVMRFDTGGSASTLASITLPDNAQAFEELIEQEGVDVKLWPSSVIVADPRYNWAPEHWYAIDESLTADNWLKKNLSNGDIFMATSDSGYLQSKWELLMLPRLADLKTSGDGNMHGYANIPSSNSRSFTSGAPACNNDRMWDTYDAFSSDGDIAALEEIPWFSGKGFKVNPYSDSTNIVLAALANTPLDWKRASTNLVTGVEDFSSMSAKDFNSKYAWNEYGSDANIAWSDIETIAAKFISSVHAESTSTTYVDWQNVYDNMNWDGENFLDVKLSGETSEIWDVDRKFFFGYWRDCFDAKQQLFLVFVRAEPVMMGGGGMGQIPPQLGARAVALVWRDPTPTKNENIPHQTRVLFYKQLD